MREKIYHATQVSSAKRRGLQLTQKGRSFMYIRNKNGPSVEPEPPRSY